MSTDLADIPALLHLPDEFVPLRREVEILRRYMEIQSIRCPGQVPPGGGHAPGAGG